MDKLRSLYYFEVGFGLTLTPNFTTNLQSIRESRYRASVLVHSEVQGGNASVGVSNWCSVDQTSSGELHVYRNTIFKVNKFNRLGFVIASHISKLRFFLLL